MDRKKVGREKKKTITSRRSDTIFNYVHLQYASRDSVVTFTAYDVKKAKSRSRTGMKKRAFFTL